MNRIEAIEILDHPQSEVSAELRAEALSVLEGDAVATAEMRERAEVDTMIAKSFAAITPPAGLRNSILAAMLEAGESPTEPEVVPFGATSTSAGATRQRAFWLRPWALGAAAAVVLGIILWQPLQEISLEPGGTVAQQELAQANVSSFVTALSSRLANAGPYLQRSNDMDELATYLHLVESPVVERYGLPERMKHMQPVGCRVLDVNGYKVSMICMRDDAFFHLIVASAEAGGPTRLTRPTDFQAGEHTYVAWHQDDKLLMLVSRAPAETIHNRLAGMMAGQ